MEDLQELRDVIVQLRADNERLTRERAEAAASTAATSVSTNAAPRPSTPSSMAPDRLLYVPRERKCPMFHGNIGIGIMDWVEEVRASMRARHLAPIDQAYFIYDHLEGEAKKEIKYRPKEEREDPEKVLTILQELYSCSQSYVSLQELFFSRKQLEGESLQEYSHALFSLMERVVRSAPNSVPNSAILLRDQFVEQVNDPNLRRTLKQVVRTNPNATLLSVRSEALRWEQEGRPAEGRPRSYSVPSICAIQTSAAPQTANTPSHSFELAELKELFKKQQQQLNEISAALTVLQNPPRRPQPNSGPVICRRCQQPGHYATVCDNERVVSQVPNNPMRRAASNSQQGGN